MSTLKIMPTKEGAAAEAAEASVPTPAVLGAAHAEAEAAARTQFNLSDVVDLHRHAIMGGDTVAAECYATVLSLVARLKRVPLLHENRATEVLQGLRLAQNGLQYLEERIANRQMMALSAGDRDADLAERRKRFEDEQRIMQERMALRRGPLDDNEDLQREAVGVHSLRGENTMTRALSAKDREAEEAAMRERAKALQAEKDGRAEMADIEKRRQMGLLDADDERSVQQMSDERLEAQIAAEARIRARKQQGRKDAAGAGRTEIGGGVPVDTDGQPSELPYDEVVARAHGGGSIPLIGNKQ